jgi:hypothetical protein
MENYITKEEINQLFQEQSDSYIKDIIFLVDENKKLEIKIEKLEIKMERLIGIIKPLITIPQPTTSVKSNIYRTDFKKIEMLLQDDLTNEWEINFLESIKPNKTLTENQNNRLNQIYTKISNIK